MSKLALNTQDAYSGECFSADAAAAPELTVESQADRIPIVLSWLITAGASAGLWLIIADLARAVF